MVVKGRKKQDFLRVLLSVVPVQLAKTCLKKYYLVMRVSYS